MPPKNAAAVASRRKGPQFNPPRPVQTQTQTSAATKRAPAAASSRATGGPKKPNASAARSRVQTAATVISSEDEQELDDLDLDDSDDLMEDTPVRATREQAASAPIAPPIPAPLLARLLYENFEDPNTQIQKGAMNLVGKYMEIFVREAFARAKNERETSVKDGGISDGFLQVEDLEKLAPQLVLDF